MATVDQIKEELKKRIEASRPVIEQKLTTDGYFGLAVKHRGETNNVPYRDFNTTVSRRRF